MKRYIISYLVFVLVIMTSVVVQAKMSQSNQGIEGIWIGKLEVPGGELRIVFKIIKDDENVLTATMDSPDQGAMGIPVDCVRYEDSLIYLEVKAAGIIYEGKLDKDGLKIEGKFNQASFSLPLNLLRSSDMITNIRPQEPKKPYPYHEEEVIYTNEEDGVKLAGTLTLPDTEGLFPAVLLITGSGAQDRNETIFGHKPFLVIADYLTRQGIAVLRVDDRGVGGSSGDIISSTSYNFAKDVLAGVKFLKTRPEINAKQIGLIGHSEGGLIAPMVAVSSNDIAFIVLMAGPGLNGEEISYLQTELISKAMGVSEEEIRKNRGAQEEIFSIVKNEADNAIAQKRIRAILVKNIQQLGEEERKSLGDIDQYIEAQVQSVTCAWLRYFLTYDPIPILRKVECPVLAINGTKDLQVPPKENLEAIEAALKEGENKDYTLIELPGLNHLFQTCETGLITEYGRIQETISPAVLKVIGDWILEHTQKD